MLCFCGTYLGHDNVIMIIGYEIMFLNIVASDKYVPNFFTVLQLITTIITTATRQQQRQHQRLNLLRQD